jgi:hypothetical protein
LDKSGRRDFQLYVAGYPLFFNEDTSDCDNASFHYWWGANRPSSDWPLNRIVYLSKDLRKELDDLVRKLNGIIAAAVEEANAEHGGVQVYYVDMMGRFSEGNHRWCEDGAKDPDSGRRETWFFLSGWGDVDADSIGAESLETNELFSQGEIQLPDAANCTSDLAAQLRDTGSVDPYAVSLCRIAEEIDEDPEGPQAQRFATANSAITNGDVSSQDVSWYLPTRQIKTFHPRSPGMAAYRDAVIEAIQQNGGI